MQAHLLDALRTTPSIQLFSSATDATIATAEAALGIALPSNHRQLLLYSNGVIAQEGWLRLYGVGPTAAIDMVSWNDPGTWKFAWPRQMTEFLCIGEDGFGDQFAYRISDLVDGRLDAPLWFIPVVYYAPGHLGDSLASYLTDGFLPLARSALDDFEGEVMSLVGPLPPAELAIQIPSMLLSGAEDASLVRRMPAEAAMVANGDIWTQADGMPDDANVTGIEPYTDDHGRTRLRVQWTRS